MLVQVKVPFDVDTTTMSSNGLPSMLSFAQRNEEEKPTRALAVKSLSSTVNFNVDASVIQVRLTSES
jgi:hypothetical protein